MQEEYWSDEDGEDDVTSEDNVIDTPDVPSNYSTICNVPHGPAK